MSYIFDKAKSSSYIGKSLGKKSMLENFRANVLKRVDLLHLEISSAMYELNG